MDLISIGTDVSDEHIADYGADCDDKGCADVDEQFGRAVADEELSAATYHEVECLLGRGTEAFAGNSHHDISIFSQEADDSFEACNQTSNTFN